MILRDCFRYQNYLDSIINVAEMYLCNSNNTMITEETHERSKIRPEAADEVKSSVDSRDMNVNIDNLIEFVMMVIKEKEDMSVAINMAKTEHCPSFDYQIAMNIVRQSFANTLKRVIAQKGKEWTKTGTAYCFNAEGNQVSYCYDVKYKSRIDFDRANAKKALNEITTRSDEISNEIDSRMSSVQVDFTPKFSINDTFEELVERFPEFGIGGTEAI